MGTALAGSGNVTANAATLQGHQFIAGPTNPFNGADNPNLPGGFNPPPGVAVDNSASPSAGDVYVADQGNGVVDKFTPAGAFICEIAATPGVAGTECGNPASPQASTGFYPSGMAVDPATGDLYVTDIGNNAVYRFDATGAFICEINGAGTNRCSATTAPAAFNFVFVASSVAFDTSGNVYVTDDGNGVLDEFDSSGAYTGQITGLTQPLGVAVDTSSDPADTSAGDIYIVDSTTADSTGHSQLEKYSPAGTLISVLDGGPLVTAVVVDPAGYVYVDHGSEIQQYDSSGASFFRFGEGFLAQSEGIAYSDTTGDLYVSDLGTPNNPEDNVRVFSPFTLTAPTPVVLAASNFSRTGAVFHGSVDPEGLASRYRFEYVTDAQFRVSGFAGAARAPRTDAELPPGFEGDAISLPVSGLEPSTVYHYRLVATNGVGPATSSEQTFTTSAATPPGAVTGGASGVTGSSATVSGVVNPSGIQTSYRFELGTSTAYGTAIFGSAGSGSGGETVQAVFSSLQAATTYHYRVTAVSGDGTVSGVDQVFTTSSPAMPVLGSAPVFPDVTGLTPQPGSKTAGGGEENLGVPLTGAQKLGRALQVCKAKRNRAKRAVCEKQARKRYGAKRKAKGRSARAAIDNRRTKQ